MVSDMGGRMRGALWGPGRYGRLLNLGNWVMVIFFFFSSRRRHTRWPRDWSSECALPILYFAFASLRGSGELAGAASALAVAPSANAATTPVRNSLCRAVRERPLISKATPIRWFAPRSEERRVGKECAPRAQERGVGKCAR